MQGSPPSFPAGNGWLRGLVAQYRIFHLSINRVWLNLVVYYVILKLIQNYELRNKWVVCVQLLPSSCVQQISPPLSKVSPEDDLHSLFWKKPSMKTMVIWRNFPCCCLCCNCFLWRPQSLLWALKLRKALKTFRVGSAEVFNPGPSLPGFQRTREGLEQHWMIPENPTLNHYTSD